MSRSAAVSGQRPGSERHQTALWCSDQVSEGRRDCEPAGLRQDRGSNRPRMAVGAGDASQGGFVTSSWAGCPKGHRFPDTVPCACGLGSAGVPGSGVALLVAPAVPVLLGTVAAVSPRCSWVVTLVSPAQHRPVGQPGLWEREKREGVWFSI